MNNEVTIRQIRFSDAKDLQRNVFPNNYLWDIKISIRKSIKLRKKKKAYRFVAVFNNMVIGNVELIRNAHPLLCHRGEIFSLFVFEKTRRQGVGKLLINQCIKTAKVLGLNLLTLSVRGGTEAEKFYTSIGFKRYGKLPGGIYQEWDDNTFNECLYYLIV